MADKKYPPQSELRKRLRYDASTGLLYWLPKGEGQPGAARFNAVLAGREAGAKHPNPNAPSGFARAVNMVFDGAKHTLLAHRIVWIMERGPIPPEMLIDHANGDNCDNRLANLRLATHAQNMRNRKPGKHNRSKVVGVRRKHRRWHALISVDGRSHWLGSYPTIALAAAARRAAEIAYFGEFSPYLSRRKSP